MSQSFWQSPEQFARATMGRKNVCPEKNCNGVLFSVEQPRIRSGLNQQSYKCDRCGCIHVVQGGQSNATA